MPTNRVTPSYPPPVPEEAAGTGRRFWALSDWPTRTVAGHFALAVVLGLAVTFETLHFATRFGAANFTILASGLFASACAMPLRRPPLTVRGLAAACGSLACTAVMLGLRPSIHLWGVGESVALLVLLSGVLRRTPTGQALWLGPVIALAAVTTPARDAHPGPVTATIGAVTVATVALALYLRQQDAQRDLAVERARGTERLELARELHDFVAHHVTGILVQAQTARAVPDDEPGNRLRMARIEEAANEALTAMRRVVRVLREEDSTTAPPAGLDDIAALAADFRLVGPPVDLDIDPSLRRQPAPNLTASAHRVVREALTNIRKHAPAATRVEIALRRTATGLRVEVTDTDDAARREPAPTQRRGTGQGFGLLGLSERTGALGGHFEAGPTADGWRVLAEFPETPDEHRP
ncbi:signal transduction histidine kinase [Streptacidiphilus sp. MAP12-33]|uniref:sensor histidine kinase n=1 Tax=Streptacidiphilus sp. MAP12-33 TaxID=3156266 RepID=UPI003519BD34